MQTNSFRIHSTINGSSCVFKLGTQYVIETTRTRDNKSEAHFDLTTATLTCFVSARSGKLATI